MLHRLALGCTALAVSLPSLATQDAPPAATADPGIGRIPPIRLQRYDHAAAAIEIDGHLVERPWSEVAAYDYLKIIEPDTLHDPPYRTDIRMFYTERGFYLSFDMEQPQDTIIERYAPRDDRDTVRDFVAFTLDTSGSGRYGYWVNLAMGDNKGDGTILPERQYSREWDGAWYGATQRTEHGWAAEIFLPWSQVAMPAEVDVRRMGIYASRKVSHLNERWSWPALPSSRAKFISDFQPLEMAGVAPRRQWSLFPFVSTTYDRIESDASYKAGFDVFWRPSTNFQLTGTVNPDFGSIESDDVIVNLTADETFFPEKRLFFQEGQEIFNTTPRADDDSGQLFTVINTRRIGGRPRPPALPPGVALPTRQLVQPTDLLGAAKATGQLGAIRYGVLGAFEDDTGFNANDRLFFQQGRDFAAVRVLYEDDRNAAYRGLGFISTVVAHPDSDAVVHAADFHWLSLTGRWGIDGQVLTSDRDTTGRGYGAYADITYRPRQGLKHKFELTAFDDTLDVNDFGFQRRNDAREIWYRLEWIKSGLKRIRDFKITPFLRYEVNGDGFRTNNAIASNFEFTLNDLDRIEGFVAHFPKRFDDRNSFGNGVFDVAPRQQLEVLYQTNQALPFSVFGKVGYQGEFVGGETWTTAAGLLWRPRNDLNIDISATYLDRDGWLLHQEGRNFTAFDATQWQPVLNVDWFPSARQQLRLGLQWVGIRAREDEFYTLVDESNALVPGPKPPGASDSFSLSQLSFQLRYRWQIAPLSDLFVVYTRGDSRRTALQQYPDLFSDSWNDPLGDALVIKLRYRLGS